MSSLDWDAVEELSASFHLERGSRDNSYLRISGIGDCRRKIGYRIRNYIQGTPEPPQWSHLLTVFDIGHKLHLGLQHRLSNAGPLKWVDGDPIIEDGQFGFSGNFEVPLIDHQYRIRGTLDCLTRPLLKVPVHQAPVYRDQNWGARSYAGAVGLDDPTQPMAYVPVEPGTPGAKRYIIDIKTITARERVSIEEDPHTGAIMRVVRKPSAFEKLTAAKPEHIAQASFYSWLCTRPDFRSDRITEPLTELPDVMILYIAKDLDPDYYAKYPEQYHDPRGLLNSPFKIFTVPASRQRISALLRKVEGIWRALDAGELPPRDHYHTPERTAWACVDCPFRRECYEVEGYFQEPDPETPLRVIRQRLSDQMLQVT